MTETQTVMPGAAGATTKKKQPEFDQPPADPIALLREWFDAAGEKDVSNPGALALGTVDEQGRTSVRIVAVISITADGLLFTSHAASQKGKDIAANPWASGVLYWRETSQQLTVAGPVEKLTDAESDALWESRPASTYPMSVASEQSAPLADEEALRAEAERLAESDEPLARPDGWAGYHLVPTTVEFWQGSPDRLHRRLRYDQTGSGWTSERLQP
jgi:dihydrophenazinedicarboxylate synthase